MFELTQKLFFQESKKKKGKKIRKLKKKEKKLETLFTAREEGGKLWAINLRSSFQLEVKLEQTDGRTDGRKLQNM